MKWNSQWWKFYPVYEDANTKVGFYGDEEMSIILVLKEGHWEYLNLDRDQLGNVIPTEGDHYNLNRRITGEHLYSDLAAQEYGLTKNQTSPEINNSVSTSSTTFMWLIIIWLLHLDF